MNHDHRVRLEVASPGEWKSEGKGWTLTTGFGKSPFGTCLIAESPRGICHLSFVDAKKNKTALNNLQKDWPKATLDRDDSRAAKLSGQIFNRARHSNSRKNLRAFVKGTEFQVRVWKALLKIESGALITYGDLAKAVGNPDAARAVGSALGKNSVAYLIPCHRVIRGTGMIGNYRWGGIRKRALIAWEGARCGV